MSAELALLALGYAVILGHAWIFCALVNDWFCLRGTVGAWVFDVRTLSLLERVWLGFVLWDDGVQRFPRPAPQVTPAYPKGSYGNRVRD